MEEDGEGGGRGKEMGMRGEGDGEVEGRECGMAGRGVEKGEDGGKLERRVEDCNST